MTTIIALYALGITATIGCFQGAMHHAMTAGALLIFATSLLQEHIASKRANHKPQTK